ncbi:Lrp/AsnC ligand binding domain-containing protein [Croceicoccus naphthovorans]|uniref:Lrp/AsnC ligand binding domain-containing protein n=1 Tax=Croceicoccus naphthovorans TaxID=1348774 RepID=UPI00069DE2E2|nr:hypothetical protein [Croceicoccus naphthovorans]
MREFDPDAALAAALRVFWQQGYSGSSMAILTEAMGITEIYALHTTNGSWDPVAGIVSASLPGFDRVLGEVRTTEGVLNSETSILLRSLQ